MSRGYVYAAFGRGGRKSRRDRTIIIYDLELVMWKVSKNKRMGFDVEKKKKKLSPFVYLSLLPERADI